MAHRNFSLSHNRNLFAGARDRMEDYVPNTAPPNIDEPKEIQKVPPRLFPVYRSGSMAGKRVTELASFIDETLYLHDTDISDLNYNDIVKFSQKNSLWLSSHKNKTILSRIKEEAIKRQEYLSSEQIRSIANIIGEHWIRKSDQLLGGAQEPKWIQEEFTEDSCLLTTGGGHVLDCFELKIIGDVMSLKDKRKIVKKAIDIVGVKLAQVKSGEAKWKLASRFQPSLKKFRKREWRELDI